MKASLNIKSKCAFPLTTTKEAKMKVPGRGDKRSCDVFWALAQMHLLSHICRVIKIAAVIL